MPQMVAVPQFTGANDEAYGARYAHMLLQEYSV